LLIFRFYARKRLDCFSASYGVFTRSSKRPANFQQCLLAIAILSVRPSVRPSVRHTGGSVKNGAS